MSQSDDGRAIEDAEIVDLPREEQEAEETVREVFGSEENAQKTGGVIASFVASYEREKADKPINVWLTDEFRKYPGIWKDDADLTDTARDIIQTVETANEKKASLYAHLDAGKSKESWLAKSIEQGAAAAGVVDVGKYAQGIDTALGKANADMASSILTQSGRVSQLPNLDGFIAEQHHAATFNLEAASQGSQYRAEVLTPKAGEAFAKNSVDIVIKDGNGNVVRRYQAKYGQDAEATQALFKDGDYRGQRKLVPEGQAKAGESTDCIEIDGIKSKSLSKEEAKALQEKAQVKGEVKQYKWNDANRITIAKQIGKQAFVSAGCVAVGQGVRIIGRRIWNALCGKENQSASEDMREFFEESIKGAANTGVQVAVSGGVVVAARNGWIKFLRNTPAGTIANIVYVGMENARVLYKFAKGEVSATEALDAMGNVTCSTVGAIAGATKGGAIGATIGSVLGPVGTVVGGFVGAFAGGVAGSKIGTAIWEGGKMIVDAAVDVVKTAWEGIESVGSAVCDFVGELFAW